MTEIISTDIIIYMIIIASVGIIFGIMLGFYIRKRIVERQLETINSYSTKIINEAHKQAKTIKKEAMLRAKDTIYQMKLDFEKETKEIKGLLQAQERRLLNKEEFWTRRSINMRVKTIRFLSAKKTSSR